MRRLCATIANTLIAPIDRTKHFKHTTHTHTLDESMP